MRYFYGEFDGSEFPTPDGLFGFDQIMQFILQFGQQALQAIEQMLENPQNPQQSEMLEKLLRDGMIEKDGVGYYAVPQASSLQQARCLRYMQ